MRNAKKVSYILFSDMYDFILGEKTQRYHKRWWVCKHPHQKIIIKQKLYLPLLLVCCSEFEPLQINFVVSALSLACRQLYSFIIDVLIYYAIIQNNH